MKIYTVAELYRYPVKSCGGMSLSSAEVGPMGINYDRQWMFTRNNMFVAQRGDPKSGAIGVPSMYKIKTKIVGDSLILSAPEMPDLILPLAGLPGILQTVRVWDSFSEAVDQGDEAARWGTEYLSREVPGGYRLVRMPDIGTRMAKKGNAKVAFGDAYPFLILSQASLDNLNNKLIEKLPMNRFRPNIVIKGCAADEEDTMPDFMIRQVRFIGMNLCLRCVITTTNQITGERGKEPLATLATYKRFDDGIEKGVVFARNFNHEGTGTIFVGDPLIFS